MPWTKTLKVTAAAGVVGFGGCAVGPDYHPSPTHAEAGWTSTPADGLTESASASSSWWMSFNDAELDSLIRRAVQSNKDLRVAEARLRQARAVREMSAANLWPSLDASGSYARAKQSRNQPLIGALPLPPNFPFEYSVYQAGFDASWEIDLFGSKRRALEASTADWEGTIESRNDALVSLLAEVARNYVELRGGQLRLEIAQRNLKLEEEAVELARARFQSGVAGELDVTRAAASAASRGSCWRNFRLPSRCRRRRPRSQSGCRPTFCAAGRMCATPNGNWRPRLPELDWRSRTGFQSSH